MFFKIGVLKNFAKFTGNHLWHSLFFNKVAGHFFCRTSPLGASECWILYFHRFLDDISSGDWLIIKKTNVELILLMDSCVLTSPLLILFATKENETGLIFSNKANRYSANSYLEIAASNYNVIVQPALNFY